MASSRPKKTRSLKTGSTRTRASKPLPRPHKRPTQERSRFTVAALYQAFVRIWHRDGPDAASMRAIAEEAGYAVGTLYEYFPNREAVLSGYFRHCLDDLARRLRGADNDPALPWRARLRRLVAATLDEAGQAPYFDAQMLLSESAIADVAEHRKAFTRLCNTIETLMRKWPDLPALPREQVERLVLHLWGGRRYAILLGRDQSMASEIDGITAMLAALIEAG